MKTYLVLLKSRNMLKPYQRASHFTTCLTLPYTTSHEMLNANILLNSLIIQGAQRYFVKKSYQDRLNHFTIDFI